MPSRKPAPTDEQERIRAAFADGRDLVVEAGAGTGKTSTLRMLADAAPGRRGVYVAYNRAIADDARASFPSSVTCATAHALAFRAVGRRFAHRLNGPRMPARETARTLGIIEPLQLDSGTLLSPEQLARIVTETVTRFCRSASEEPQREHVPLVAGLDDDASMASLRAAALPLARRAWADVRSPDGRLKFSHDHYLKMWQLSRPVLPAEYVMLDEAQDANPVVADVVAAQSGAQRVLVGDRCQAIYGWRGAVDAMSGFTGHRLALTQSFRFGEAVAAEANKWLRVLDSPLRLRGYQRINSVVAPLETPDAVLCRTNAEAVAQVLTATGGGRPAALVGGGREIRRLAEAAITLKAGAGTDHPELFAFRTWGELQDYVTHDSGGADLKVFVHLVDSYGPDVVIDAVDRLVSEQRAAVVISTAHRAKGREWDTVRVAGDFPAPEGERGDGPQQPSYRGAIGRAEAMLAYVAVTRARHVLDRAGLSWIDRWLSAGNAQPGNAQHNAPSAELEATRR